MFHLHNFWAPFGDDHPANQAALDARQTALDRAAARRKYDDLLPHQRAEEASQRDLIDSLDADLDTYADRCGQERALFRKVLQERMRTHVGRWADLTSLPPRNPAPDLERRALEGERLGAEHDAMSARERLRAAKMRSANCACIKHLAAQQRRTAHCEDKLVAADEALRRYDQARRAGA